jgi:hypothetical protein
LFSDCSPPGIGRAPSGGRFIGGIGRIPSGGWFIGGIGRAPSGGRFIGGIGRIPSGGRFTGGIGRAPSGDRFVCGELPFGILLKDSLAQTLQLNRVSSVTNNVFFMKYSKVINK